MSNRLSPESSAAGRWLDVIERAGNRLPHPVTLFVLLALAVVVASAVTSGLGVYVRHPRDGSAIVAVNLLSRANVARMFTEAVRNFVGFAPLGTVLAAMLGVAVAERSGLIAASLEAFVHATPRVLIPSAVILAGILSHIAADAGFLIIPPVAAALFAAAGRHPLAGLAAGYAGVAGGFSANLIPGSLDVMLADLSHDAAAKSGLLPGSYRVQVLGNYYFMAASVPVLVLAGTWVTLRITERRLRRDGANAPRPGATPHAPGARQIDHAPAGESVERIPDALRRRGFMAAFVALMATLALFWLLVGPSWAPLRTDGVTTLQRVKPFLDSIVVHILLLFLVPGLAFGIATGRIRSDHDVAKMMGDVMGTMGTYIVLAFFAAQFINYFSWSNLGAILAISGANALRAIGLTGTGLMIGFVLLTAVLNLLVSSASAKWAVMGPVFVPMFLQLGYAPEATQVVYRIGDSCTNIVTPLMPYLPIILAFARRYNPDIRVGTLLTMMVPYSLAFLASWTLLLTVWMALDWPLGPGVGFHMP